MTGVEVFGKVAIDVALERTLTELARVKWRFLGCRLRNPYGDMRISCSALLRIEVDDSYILIRNVHRRGTFAPIGGVFKRHPESRAALDVLEFRPQAVSPEMVGDLRGFVPRLKTGAFDAWFQSGVDRETAAECLRRELTEELHEIGLASVGVPAGVRFRGVRVVSEGPDPVEGHPFTQFRQFAVYELSPHDSSAHSFVRDLMDRGKDHDGLLVASAKEILLGRSSDGRHIAHHAAYLFQTRRVMRDEPMFAGA